jgi:hypothetical protein
MPDAIAKCRCATLPQVDDRLLRLAFFSEMANGVSGTVTLKLLQAVRANSEVEGVRAFREACPDSSLLEARDAFAELREQWLQSGGADLFD